MTHRFHHLKLYLEFHFIQECWNVEEDGTFTTDVYSMSDSQEFLEDYALTPTMDNISGQNYIEVVLDDITHKLWIEDAESMAKRAEIVIEYNLAGNYSVAKRI